LVVASDVALPATRVFVTPIFVPAVPSQPPAVTSDGWQRKKSTVPVGAGAAAGVVDDLVTVAVSLTESRTTSC
jgi:hypothetical protein